MLRTLYENDERYVEEMRGIADGAGVDVEDVLSINVRTEVMFAAKARQAEAAGHEIVDGARQGECSAFAVLPPASANGHTLVGSQDNRSLTELDREGKIVSRYEPGVSVWRVRRR